MIIESNNTKWTFLTLMESSFLLSGWFDIINLEWSNLYIKGGTGYEFQIKNVFSFYEDCLYNI